MSDFWHASCQYNTNSSEEFSVLNYDDPENPFYEVHRVRLQTDSTQIFTFKSLYLNSNTFSPFRKLFRLDRN